MLEEELTFSTTTFYDKVRQVVGREKVFQTWFSRTSVENVGTSELILKVPSRLALDWIQSRYSGALKDVVLKTWNMELKIVEGEPSVVQTPSEPTPAPAQGQLDTTVSPLPIRKGHKSYSFEGFISGPENQLAYVAAQGVLLNESYVHSPLVLVGDHGMGKTHLVSCISNSMPANQVLCWHAEEFSNAYIQAMRNGQNSETLGSGLESFRAMIRSKKVFILEDLDFFLEGNKKKTLDELVNSLKVLKRENRHIVITSSQPIYSYEAIAPKLSNFLMSGLSVKLNPPSPATRTKMIDYYRQQFACSLAPKCWSFIEEIPFRSPRELKGAIKQVSAYAVLEKEQLPLTVVREILSDHLRIAGEQMCTRESQDLHAVAKAVCHQFGVSLQKLISTSRERHVSAARHLAMALSYELHFTLKEIGQFYGGRLHQSVLFATKKVSDLRQKDLDFKAIYDRLQKELKSSLSP